MAALDEETVMELVVEQEWVRDWMLARVEARTLEQRYREKLAARRAMWSEGFGGLAVDAVAAAKEWRF